MRVMVIVKASKSSEAGELPSEQLLKEMMDFNEQLSRAGSTSGQCQGLGRRIGPFEVWKHLRVAKTVAKRAV